MKPPRYLRRLARIARRAGWTLEWTGGGHVRFRPPDDGNFVIASATPSDRTRAEANVRSELARNGLEV